ncbi:hypothetical protein HDN1F_09100 [gamma proteobacterium HdN1]|nr:hypothetical protein HDN1F_09100 [gamma proteobacterium HdN1]
MRTTRILELPKFECGNSLKFRSKETGKESNLRLYCIGRYKICAPLLCTTYRGKGEFYLVTSLPYILPWLLLLLAAGGAFAHKKLEFRSKWWIVSIAGISSLFLIFNLLIMAGAWTQSKEVSSLSQKISDLDAWKYRYMDEITLAISQIRPLSQQDNAIIDKIKGWGWLPSQPALQQLDAADQARSRILTGYYPSGNNLFKGLPKLVDQKLVELSLRQAGFQNVPYRADEEVPDEINVLYFGSKLDVRDIKLAALTLMRAGVELKAIKPFPQASDGNLQAIKGEYSKTMNARRTLTTDSVEKANVFR